jgi:hypothetical protein
MAARDRDDIGPDAMEIAFDVSPFAIAGFRISQPPRTAMIAMSMLAMVICLFGGYVDSPNEHAAQQGGATICRNVHSQSRSNEKEIMTMNPRRNAIVAWGFSTWFAYLSPVIGILLGLFGAFLVLR